MNPIHRVTTKKLVSPLAETFTAAFNTEGESRRHRLRQHQLRHLRRLHVLGGWTVLSLKLEANGTEPRGFMRFHGVGLYIC